MNAFKEDALFEQGNIEEKEENSFYLTGSHPSLGNIPGTFSGGLQNKDQIKVSFSVNSPTLMLENSSSIYYFDHEYGCWTLPPDSIDDHVGPFSKWSFPTFSIDNSAPERGSGGTSSMIEDFKCFDPYGKNIASGSFPVPGKGYLKNNSYFAQGLETPDSNLIKQNGSTALVPFLTKDYPLSVQRSSIYDGSINQTFSLNITQPFLIEKVVIEIPVENDYDWKSDKTLSYFSLDKITTNYNGQEKNSFVWMSGGPGVTFSLFCQKQFGLSKIRDLICSDLVTNENDSKNTFSYFEKQGEDNKWGLYFYNKGVKDSFSLKDDDKKVLLKMNASVSNGASSGFVLFGQIWKNDIWYETFYNSQTAEMKLFYDLFKDKHFFSNPDKFISHIRNLISKEYCSLSDFSVIGNPLSGQIEGEGTLASFGIQCLNPFGRGMTGFSPSGSSIFGKEYVSISGNPILKDSIVPCPFWIKDSIEREDFIYDLEWKLKNPVNQYLWNGTDNNFSFFTSLNLDIFSAKEDSPYLLYPGDSLILAASKTRPAIGSSNVDISQDPNSPDFEIGKCTLNYSNAPFGMNIPEKHKFTLDSGKINITFYGSYVSGGNRFIR